MLIFPRKKIKFQRFSGFTLAEILITLGIIGVIAAITIPLLMNNTNDKETATAVKKAYTVFSQALKMSEVDNGPVGSWGCTDATCYFNKITPYLKIAKNCGINTGQGCFPKGVMYKQIGGAVDYGTIDDDSTYPKARLTDGMSFFISFMSSDCTTQRTGNVNNLVLNNVCGGLFVDINGDKPLNTVGKDLFALYFTKYGISPRGTGDDTVNTLSTDCSNKTGSGLGCSAWVLYKENMDYLKGVVSW